MMSTANQRELLEYLLDLITDNRKRKFADVLSLRTRHITILLEDIYQSQNASAVLRSCDLSGVQDVHIIENKNPYDINPDVVVGSTKWLNLTKYNEKPFNTLDAYACLRSKGYRIIATSPHEDGFTPENLPLDKPVALAFGTEKTGLTSEAISHADGYIRIPMVGFTESYKLTDRLRKSDINWQLTDAEKDELMLQWCRNTIQRVEVIERDFAERKKQKNYS
jgi:tRNA (guanosine-2'-O-)-methyltransferase